jgi:Tfp pilus assembly protein PilF
MSLITDAINEAQREANKRRKDSQPALLGEPFPQMTRVVAEREWLTSRTLIYGGIGFLVFASAVATGIVTYRRLKAESPRTVVTQPAAPAPVNRKPSAGVASSPRAADSAASTPPRKSVSPAPVTATATAIPPRRSEGPNNARPRDDRPRDALVPPSSRTVAGVTPANREPAGANARSAPTVTTPAAARTNQEPLSPALPVQSRASGDAMRVVVDPKVLRPADSLFARAYAEHTRGNLDGAADLYERALAHPPVSPELYNDYGALLATRGKHAAAVAMYNLGIAANDKDARLWANLGDSYRALGRRADAMSAYFEAARLDPSNIAVKVRLAGEYALLGDTANARRGFEQAVRAAPNDPEAHYRFGAFLQTQHDVRGAIRELQTFVDLAPGRYPADVIDRTKAYIADLRRR